MTRARNRLRRGMNALLDAVDQRKLPGPAFDLPNSERDENCKGDEQEGREPQGGARTASLRSPLACSSRSRSCSPRSLAQFIPGIWCTGIMLLLRWLITHSEPDSAITTITMVKISAIMLQPFSEVVFMCRK